MSQLVYEGPTLESIIGRIIEDVGPDAHVAKAERVRRGGIAGFFSKEHFEITLATDRHSGKPVTQGEGTSLADALAGLREAPAKPLKSAGTRSTGKAGAGTRSTGKAGAGTRSTGKAGAGTRSTGTANGGGAIDAPPTARAEVESASLAALIDETTDLVEVSMPDSRQRIMPSAKQASRSVGTQTGEESVIASQRRSFSSVLDRIMRSTGASAADLQLPDATAKLAQAAGRAAPLDVPATSLSRASELGSPTGDAGPAVVAPPQHRRPPAPPHPLHSALGALGLPEALLPLLDDLGDPASQETMSITSLPAGAGAEQDPNTPGGQPTSPAPTAAQMPSDVAPVLLRAFSALPAPPRPPRRSGSVIVIVGDAERAPAFASELAADLGLDPDEVPLACPARTARRVPARLLIRNSETASERAPGWRRRHGPTVVAVVAPVNAPQRAWAHHMVKALRPTALWGVVDATVKSADITAWSEALGGLDALVLTGTEQTTTPADVLTTGIPVARIDGMPATSEQWTALMTARLG